MSSNPAPFVVPSKSVVELLDGPRPPPHFATTAPHGAAAHLGAHRVPHGRFNRKTPIIQHVLPAPVRTKNLWRRQPPTGFAWPMRIERFDSVTDTEKIRVCHDLFVAAQRVDDPHVPPASLPVFTGWVSRGWDANPREGWLVPGDQAGTWAAYCLLEFPVRENRHLADIDLLVALGQRRRGIGMALLRHAVIRAAGQGRTKLVCDTREGTAGEAFATAVGADRGGTEVRRVLALPARPAGRLDALREQAEAASDGYSIVTWFGRFPEEYLAKAAAVINAMADAPHNPSEEPEVHDGDRLRDGEELDLIQKNRGYSVAAICDQTG